MLKGRFKHKVEGRSHGLVVMGGDSCSEGRGSNPCTVNLMDIFLHLFVVKIVMFIWKDKKRPRDAPFFKKVVRRPFENSLVDSLGQIHQSLDGDYVKKQQTVEQRALTRPLP